MHPDRNLNRGAARIVAHVSHALEPVQAVIN